MQWTLNARFPCIRNCQYGHAVLVDLGCPTLYFFFPQFVPYGVLETPQAARFPFWPPMGSPQQRFYADSRLIALAPESL
jgi:hypothetical protein